MRKIEKVLFWLWVKVPPNPVEMIKRAKNKKERRRQLEQFIPGESFVSGCFTDAMVVTAVDFDEERLHGIDLKTREERIVSVPECLNDVLSGPTALAIAISGTSFEQARELAFKLAGENPDEEGNFNSYNFSQENALKIIEEVDGFENSITTVEKLARGAEVALRSIEDEDA